ncbi:hypothetical protein CM240_1586 [Clostridium bornimense]|uniref:Uncharacterized protein n=1 Tax=Clostridium bornimense TaxID=1216932 RepID=W6RYQ1_9CLOT|nr:hypothetical protein [Clostridium bornimense]CDM68744.1 hypothetical protein CM240_1586 [Clostridium bornimense]
MKKRTKETMIIGGALIALSLLLHYGHYLIFQDLHHTLIFLVADLAFIPMEVFFTTLVLDKFLEKRQNQHLFEKLNMIIGVFYTEVGTRLLYRFAESDDDIEDLKENAVVNLNCSETTFKQLETIVENHNYVVNMDKVDLKSLRDLLDYEKDLLINLITNPTLLEHEEFTEMMMSIMHLREELDSRCSESMEEYEIIHISSDISKAYKYLAKEWVRYMKYLKNNYPQLFLKAVINNPFDRRDKREKDYLLIDKNRK